MSGFFGIDGPFYKFGNILADVILISSLCILLSIPVITIGPAITAAYYVATRRIANKDGYLVKDFFTSFTRNFKQATLSWILILFAGIVIAVNFHIIWTQDFDKIRVYLLPLQICCLIELAAVSSYIFPIISRFELKFFDAFKSSFYMANKHLITTVIVLAVAIGTILITSFYPLYIFAAMGVYSYVTSYLFMRIFKKYRPEIDKDAFDELRSVYK